MSLALAVSVAASNAVNANTERTFPKIIASLQAAECELTGGAAFRRRPCGARPLICGAVRTQSAAAHRCGCPIVRTAVSCDFRWDDQWTKLCEISKPDPA